MSSEDHWQLMQLGVMLKNQNSQALTPKGLEACGKLVATTELSVSTSPMIIRKKGRGTVAATSQIGFGTPGIICSWENRVTYAAKERLGL